VHGDRRPGLDVGLPDRAQDPLNVRGEHEDVLVHQGGAQPIHGHRAASSSLMKQHNVVCHYRTYGGNVPYVILG
jgi:hypothetical protein